MAVFWSVAQCHPQRETAAAAHLERQGFEIYLPKIKEPASSNGARRLAPLFPGYLFVQIVSTWYPILSTIGVLRLLRSGEQPYQLDPTIIARIQRQEVRGVVKLPETRMKPGDKVRILRGTFRDHIGVYDGMGAKQRERILLELLGRSVPIEISPEDFVALNVAP